MKHLLYFFFFILMCNGSAISQNEQAMFKVDAPVIYPKIRIWTSPALDEEPAFNSPSFQWPSTKKGSYGIRMSTLKDFSDHRIEKHGIPFAIFNPHTKLSVGKWYWQFKTEKGNWGKIDSFEITRSTPNFLVPEFSKLVDKISVSHPRVLASKELLPDLRYRTLNYKEYIFVINEANKYLNESLPDESSGKPKIQGKNDYENEKLALHASKELGGRISEPLAFMSKAFILTGDQKYFVAAKKWMLDASALDPDGITVLGNFGDGSIMSSLAIGVDTFWELLTTAERETIVKQVSARANRFYDQWRNQVEVRSSSMHVWQGLLLDLYRTSMALMHETGDAPKWMEYVYELWIAQAPKMAETDGSWFNGIGYFKLNTLAMLEIAFSLKDLTGVDFLSNPWYKNNPRWMMYAFPPGSVTDGFCNGSDGNAQTVIRNAAYVHLSSAIFNDPYSAWYAAESLKTLNYSVQDDPEFYWFRIVRGNTWNMPKPIDHFDLPQAAVFLEGGVAYMHTALQDSKNDLMLSLRSSPFGPLAHAHAEQNTFNLAYGGKKLFYNTGYRINMGDPHFLGWYKDTRGHNGVLIDGLGQPFNAGAYGWIPRFLHGKVISYAVGDASNAYSGFDEGEKIDLGMKTFRRHYIMLRPSVMVLYDELEADHPAAWTWLLHNEDGFQADPLSKTLLAHNQTAKAKVSLYSSSPIDFVLTDTFSVSVENWKQKRDEDGELLEMKNQWHFSGVTREKTRKMRYLAIFQIKPDGKFEEIDAKETLGVFSFGGWEIKAEMDVSKPASIKVWSDRLGASLVSEGSLISKGTTFNGATSESSKLLEIIDGKQSFQETMDQIPNSIKIVLNRNH
jgi:hypothetical protein